MRTQDEIVAAFERLGTVTSSATKSPISSVLSTTSEPGPTSQTTSLGRRGIKTANRATRNTPGG